MEIITSNNFNEEDIKYLYKEYVLEDKNNTKKKRFNIYSFMKTIIILIDILLVIFFAISKMVHLNKGWQNDATGLIITIVITMFFMKEYIIKARQKEEDYYFDEFINFNDDFKKSTVKLLDDKVIFVPDKLDGMVNLEYKYDIVKKYDYYNNVLIFLIDCDSMDSDSYLFVNIENLSDQEKKVLDNIISKKIDKRDYV